VSTGVVSAGVASVGVVSAGGKSVEPGSELVSASNAKCFEVTTDEDGNASAQAAPCADVVAALDDSPDGLCASMLGRPTHEDNGDLAFAAEKLTVWL
jgi:hypothetical protein